MKPKFVLALSARFTHKNVRSDQKCLSYDLRKGRIPSEQVIGIRGSVHCMGTLEDTTKKEWLGPGATARDKEPVAGKTITLVKDVSETDRYGRLLRCVFVDNVLVNYELWREGYAKATQYKPDMSCEQLFYKAQLQAQHAHVGLWSTGAAS